jgi:hypothetical protein
MCAGCAMSAMAGASGLRAWLQTRGWSFVTPERLRRATIAAFVVATLVSTVGLSGSTRPAAAGSASAKHQRADANGSVSSTPASANTR